MSGRRSDVLRVAHVVATDNFAGVERYITYIAPALASRGLDVTVSGGDPLRMAAALDGTGVGHRPAASMGAVARRLLQERHVDVVHAHMTAAEAASAAMKPLVRARLVVTRHFAARRGSSGAAQAVGRVVARSIDCELAISRHVAQHVDGATTVLLNAVPSAASVGGGEPVVLVAQRMEAEKQGGVVIDCWARSELASDGWRLRFAGDGAQRDLLRAKAQELGVASSVDFLGSVDHLPELMERAAIFLATAPSEPFGLSVAEAMAHGMAIVATGAGGHLETAGAAVPESMFPPGDAAAAARLLRRLASEPELRRRHGDRHREFQRRELSIDRHVDRLVTIYESLRCGR